MEVIVIRTYRPSALQRVPTLRSPLHSTFTVPSIRPIPLQTRSRPPCHAEHPSDRPHSIVRESCLRWLGVQGELARAEPVPPFLRLSQPRSYNKTLRSEVSSSAMGFLMAEMVSYAQTRVDSISDLESRCVDRQSLKMDPQLTLSNLPSLRSSGSAR